MNPELFIGLTVQEAKELAETNNIKFRITVQDERPFIITTDFLTNRINVEVKKGKVVRANFG